MSKIVQALRTTGLIISGGFTSFMALSLVGSFMDPTVPNMTGAIAAFFLGILSGIGFYLIFKIGGNASSSGSNKLNDRTRSAVSEDVITNKNQTSYFWFIWFCICIAVIILILFTIFLFFGYQPSHHAAGGIDIGVAIRQFITGK